MLVGDTPTMAVSCPRIGISRVRQESCTLGWGDRVLPPRACPLGVGQHLSRGLPQSSPQKGGRPGGLMRKKGIQSARVAWQTIGQGCGVPPPRIGPSDLGCPQLGWSVCTCVLHVCFQPCVRTPQAEPNSLREWGPLRGQWCPCTSLWLAMGQGPVWAP